MKKNKAPIVRLAMGGAAMNTTDLPKQIARMQQSIARLEAKAARCNGGTELGRAVATRAEKSATHYRKHLEKLQQQLNALCSASLHATEASSAPLIDT
jgi:hypothetical protein